jgi:hypothetical protein
VFPPQTNDFQKPIKFVSTLGKVFFGKKSEKASGEEPDEKPGEEKPVDKPSGEKPSEQPHPKPIKFCFKRKREERMAKEWANKDRYNPSHGVPKPRMSLPRGKLL